MATQSLLAWINTHDCGVTPTAVLRDDGAIEIRIATRAEDGSWGVDTEVVRTLTQARNALGY